ncbi:MAG: NAD(P)H-hydrate epimerase [Pirellulaceae bacterium]
MNAPTPTFLTCKQSREVDAVAINKLGIPGIVLMENAGRSCAEAIANLKPTSIVVLCGLGNNGGDGFVISRHLASRGFTVQCVVLGDVQRISGDAKTNFGIVTALRLRTSSVQTETELENALNALPLSENAIIVDAMLGTGSTGEPRGLVRPAIEWANDQLARRIAIDLPSGFDADSGDFGVCVFQADQTFTFVAEKTGFRNKFGRPPLGKVLVFDIGFPLSAILDDLS